VTINGEAITASPRAEQKIFSLPGALTTTWDWRDLDAGQSPHRDASAGTGKDRAGRLHDECSGPRDDGTTPINVTTQTGAANDSGAITQNYLAGASLTVSVQLRQRDVRRAQRT